MSAEPRSDASADHRADVANRVREILADTLHRPAEEIHLEDRLLEDLGLQSVDLLSLTFALEDAFGRELADEDLQRLTTVDSVVALLAGEPAATGERA
jgi:acyl carrier protein